MTVFRSRSCCFVWIRGEGLCAWQIQVRGVCQCVHRLVCRVFRVFFFQAEDGIRDIGVTGVQTCALPISELDPQLAEMLRPKVERLNYLGEFFQCTGHQPRALMSFYSLTEDLKDALPDNITELVALTVAAKMRNAYERVQHERLALKLGFG